MKRSFPKGGGETQKKNGETKECLGRGSSLNGGGNIILQGKGRGEKTTNFLLLEGVP